MDALTHRLMMAASVAATVTSQYINQSTDDTSQTTYNFGDFTIPEDGLVVVGFMAIGNNNRTVSNVSIGGSSGTIHVSNASNTKKYAIASRQVSAGNHNVSVTLSGSNGAGVSAAVGVWLVTDFSNATPHHAASNTGFGSSLDLDLNTPAGGVAVFGFVADSDFPAPSLSWSTATQRYQGTVNNKRHAFADKETVSATPHTETVTSTADDSLAFVGASWL